MNRFDPRLPQFPPSPTDEYGNPLPWAPGNPQYDAFMRGELRIVPREHDMELPAQYHGNPMEQQFHPQQVEMVARDHTGQEQMRMLKEQGFLPRRSTGTQGIAVIDQAAIMADCEYAFARNLIGYTIVQNPDIAPPPVDPAFPTQTLSVPPTGGPPLVGGCIALAELRFGHDGVNQTVFYDLPPGAMVKVPFAGSAAKLFGRLAPKYYTNDDGTLVANKRVYRLFPGGPQLTNAQFNNLPGRLLSMNNFTTPNPVAFQGFFADGSVANGDSFSKPTRRFYGSVKTTGAIRGQGTIVPVAWNAVAVMVTGGLTNADGTSIGVQFVQNGPTGAVSTGPYGRGVVQQLINNCQNIEVYDPAASVAGSEVPFEVCYYLSF